MGDFYAERRFEFALVEDRIGRAGGLGRIFGRVARLDAAFVVPGRRGDLHGEVVPGRDALVREVVKPLVAAELLALDHREDPQREVPGIGRSSDLVEDHVQRLPFGRQPQHRFQKIVPECRIEPCRAQDQVTASRCLDGLFPGELRASIDAQRRGRGLLGVGCVGCSVEDVVGRNVDQRGSRGGCRRREVCRGEAVQAVGRRLVLLGALHIGVGRAVDDRFGAGLLRGPEDGPGVGDVEFRHVGEDVIVGRYGAQTLHFAAQLSVGARY